LVGNRHFPQRWWVTGWCAAVVLVLAGWATAATPAWFDARTLVLFELHDDATPREVQPLVQSLTAGLLRGLAFVPPEHRLIEVAGDSTAQLDSLRIDLTHVESKPRYRAAKLARQQLARPHVNVRRFELIAQPINLEGARIEYSLVAHDARLDEYRNREGEPVLVLAAASEARVQCRLQETDLQWLVLTRAREAVAKSGVEIESAHLDLQTLDEHSLLANLRLVVRKGVLRGALSLAGGLHINDQWLGQTDQIRVNGHDPVGVVLASVINRSARDYNGCVRRMVSFPSPNLELRDLRFSRDPGAAFAVTLTFGNRGPAGDMAQASAR
jgi:hypothetical protein